MCAFNLKVLGARTQKCADYLDICAAITGRVPLSGAYLDEHRAATVVIDASALLQPHFTSPLSPRVEVAESHLIEEEEMGRDIVQECGDAFWPALGYLCGLVSEARVPVIVGLEKMTSSSSSLSSSSSSHISRDDLKAFAGAFGSTASVPLFHMVGHTPEAPHVNRALAHKPPQEYVHLTAKDLAEVWVTLNSGAVPQSSLQSINSRSSHEKLENENAADLTNSEPTSALSAKEEKEASEVDVPIELVALGSPHLSLSECAAFASLLSAVNTTPPLGRVTSHTTTDTPGAAGAAAGAAEAVVETKKKHPHVRVIATLGRQVLAQAESQGFARELRSFGVELITDTCWCMLHEPVVPVHARTIVTNSAK